MVHRENHTVTKVLLKTRLGRCSTTCNKNGSILILEDKDLSRKAIFTYHDVGWVEYLLLTTIQYPNHRRFQC
ncbi:hypothetical protein EPI10_015014 [Gossypium australe]|uniref:Uncharacterized protein n=1 Tax=Gossypium australe TaxID=47621 RepID=A0A5B6VJH9_9ROSI|nr:hypothetical protein EPI10_015014 [Gossypium australe]